MQKLLFYYLYKPSSVRTIFFVSLLIVYFQNGYAQGCSDAGFCSIGALKPETVNRTAEGSKTLHRFAAGSSFGQGDDNVFVISSTMQYDFFTTKGLNIQTKLSSNYANGTLGSAFGFGDFFVSASQTKNLKNGWVITPTFGFKIPLSNANLSEGGMPLPMQYQSSLGTYDIIAGLTVANQNWQFSTGLQQPLSGENKNGFLPVLWNGKPEAHRYPPAFRFDRKGDVLLRGVRNFKINDKVVINTGLLGIFHLGKDTYTMQFEGNRTIDIAGSDGLTLNITSAAFWNIGTRARLGIVAGVPLAVRQVRPDGLTRSWVVAPEISWSF